MSKNALAKGLNNNNNHPLSVNITKMQRFDYTKFNYNDILFYEYLILYSSFVNFKEFYRSDKNIKNDIPIKRAGLEKSRKKFIELGFLKIEIKGTPTVRYYYIDYNILITKLEYIYKPEYIKDIEKSLKEFYLIKKTKQITVNNGTQTLETLQENYLNNTLLVNNICDVKRINLIRLKSYLKTFINHLKTLDQTTKKQKEFNEHFGNWISKELKNNPLPPYLNKIS